MVVGREPMTDKEGSREMKRNMYKSKRAHSIIKERKHIWKRPVNAEKFFLVIPPFLTMTSAH